MITRNRLNKGVSRKVVILAIAIMKNTLEFMIMIMGLSGEKGETLFKTLKSFHFILNLIKTHFSSLPPSPILKKDLLPLILSPKFLQKFLEIGMNASGNNLRAGIFMVKPWEEDNE